MKTEGATEAKHTPGPWTAAGLTIIESSGQHRDIGELFSCHEYTVEISEQEAQANARLIAAAPAMHKAICELECPDCGHTLEHHADRYNCDVERGDGYRIGSEILEALGPCGCECLECPDLLPLIAAIRLAKGEAK